MNDKNNEQGDIKSIDEAIAFCESRVQFYKSAANSFLRVINALIAMIVCFAAWVTTHMSQLNSDTITKHSIAAALLLAAISIIGICLAQYRANMSEVGKMISFQISFIRTRVALRNTRQEWQSSIRASLMEGAFPTPKNTEVKSDKEKGNAIPSPIPGHPALDISAQILTKIMNAAEISIKPNPKSEKA